MNEPSPSMSLRERSAWIFLASFVAVFVLFVWNAARLLVTGARELAPSTQLLLLTILVVVSAALQLFIVLRSPKEALTPRDERERLIALKSTRPAFFVLLLSTLASVGTVHLPFHGLHLTVMMNALMTSIALAGIVKFGIEVVLYRRDA